MPKKILFSLILAIVILGLVFFYFKKQNNTLKYQNLDLVAENTNPRIYKDTDGDGLKDWEEDLWKTDLNNKDSDNDGTNDFEEIRLGRDPLIKGPDDKFDPESIKGKVNQTIESDLNSTEKFSRELFARYISSKQDGKVTEGDYKDLLAVYAEKYSQNQIVIYKIEDLKSISPTPENIKKYGNDLAKLIKEKSKKYPKSELVLLDELVKNDPGTTEEFPEFKEISNRYSEIRDEMLKTNVPESAKKIHLELLNTLGILSTSVESMQFIFSDPIKTLNSISLYPYAVDIMTKSFDELNKYFIGNNIIFNSKDDGSLFTKGV